MVLTTNKTVILSGVDAALRANAVEGSATLPELANLLAISDNIHPLATIQRASPSQLADS